MPNCGSCRKPVGRLLNGLCGICDIKSGGHGPGIVGKEYVNQINSEVYDPAKEMRLGMKALEHHKDPNQRLTTQEAKRLERTLIRPAEVQGAFKKKHADFFRRADRHNTSEVKSQEAEMRAGAMKSRDKLTKLVGIASVVGPPERSSP